MEIINSILESIFVCGCLILILSSVVGCVYLCLTQHATLKSVRKNLDYMGEFDNIITYRAKDFPNQTQQYGVNLEQVLKATAKDLEISCLEYKTKRAAKSYLKSKRMKGRYDRKSIYIKNKSGNSEYYFQKNNKLVHIKFYCPLEKNNMKLIGKFLLRRVSI